MMLSTVWILFCFTANVVHISQLSYLYLKYEVTTNVRVFKPSTVEVPINTFCFDVKNSRKKRFQDIASQIFMTTKEGKSYVLTSVNTSVIEDLTNHVSLTVFTMSHLRCYQIQVHSQYQILESEILDRQSINGNSLGATGILEIRQPWILDKVSHFLTPNGRNINYAGNPYVIVSLDTPNDYRVTHVRYESRLLELPYETKCRDYSSSGGYFSKNDCLHQCLRKKCVQVYGHYCHFNNIYDSDREMDTQEIPKIDIEKTSKQNESKDPLDLIASCQESCWQRECLSIILINRVVSATKNEKNVSRIQTLSSCTPLTLAVTQPHIPFITFVTNVLSTLGFWLGLSVSGFFRVGSKVIHSLKTPPHSGHDSHDRSHGNVLHTALIQTANVVRFTLDVPPQNQNHAPDSD